jgi:ATP phosphoribosyltransferase
MKAGKELKLGIPKGSLEEMTIELFRKSGWKISTTSRSYFPSIDDDTLRCSLARPQEMSRYVESGTLDVAITGRDWVMENGSDVQLVCEMIYSKTSFRPTRWVLAVPQDSPMRYFAEREIPVEVEFSWGATEAKAAEGLVDAIVEVTETGSTIRAHGLKIIHELMESCPQLIANKEAWQDPWKREKIEQIRLLLLGALSAENKVGIKLNVAEADLENVIELIPSITAPTIATLHPSPSLKGIRWFSVESVLEEAKVRDLIPLLIRNGAVGIIEYPLNKVI